MLLAAVELSIAIFLVAESIGLPVLLVSRRRSVIAAGSLYCKVCTGRCWYQRPKDGSVAQIIATVTASPGESQQGRERARGLQSVRGVTRLDAYHHYWKRSRAVAMLSGTVFRRREVRTDDIKYWFLPSFLSRLVRVCWRLILFC